MGAGIRQSFVGDLFDEGFFIRQIKLHNSFRIIFIQNKVLFFQ